MTEPSSEHRETTHSGHDDHDGQRAGGAQHVAMPGGHITGHHPPPTHGKEVRRASTHEGHDVGQFQRKFWICLVLTIPVLVYADLIQGALGYTAPAFPGSDWMPLILSSIIFFYGGNVFLVGAYRELSRRTAGMMTLISMAITVAFVYSVAAQVTGFGMPLYWELDTLIVIMLLGHWMEMRAVGSARGALAELAKLLPDTAERVTDGGTEEVPVAELAVGDVVLVRPGSKVSADGEVIQGESSVSEAIITGESRPVSKAVGDQVIAGAVNGEGALRVRVTRIGEDTALAGIMRLVEQAQKSETQAQVLADRAAFWLTIIAITAGTATFVVWALLAGDTPFAIERTVTVLVIACPHALGLAIPLVIAISTTLSARNGILVRDRLALEQARNLKTIVFDKTGTLTKGEHGVVDIAADGFGEEQALQLAATVEGDSEHPLAKAITAEAEKRGLRRLPLSNFEALPGRGVQGQIDGQTVMAGGPRLLESLDVSLPAPLEETQDRWGREGKTAIYLVVDGKPEAAIALADVVREDSREAVAKLKEHGLRVAMLTGDSEDVAKWVSQELGIDEYFAEVLPEHKADKVKEIKSRGEMVAMVGDGVNDAPALVTADVGIAIGAGTDVAIEAADIILVKSDPRDVVGIIDLSRASYRKMVQNLAWATGYNVVAIPLAAGILASFGIFLIPAVGAIFMSASTVIVALNAQLLRRLKLT